MKISVFGLGYVGVVTSSCLANEDHEVIGVDVATAKVDAMNAGRSPIIEERVEELIGAAVAGRRLRATTSVETALSESELALVCVGTPSRRDGSLDDRYVVQVMEQIGQVLRSRKPFLHVVVRSTVVPGTLRGTVIPALERTSGRAVGDGYEVSFHPEFLREASAVYDFYNPPKIVVGERVPDSGRTVLGLYGAKIEAPRIACDLEIAEMVKYCDNIYHALKVTFANEIGAFCGDRGIDSQAVMDIFCSDTKLNISPKYLKPGFAFGGSCLPKDLRALLAAARARSVRMPLLESILPSNVSQIDRVVDVVLAAGARHIGLNGIAFKPGTDDLRESPLVELAERLLGKGRKLVVFDEQVKMARLVGGNRSYIDDKLPHLAELLTERLDDLRACELILLGHATSDARVEEWLAAGKRVIDLTGARSGQTRAGLSCIV